MAFATLDQTTESTSIPDPTPRSTSPYPHNIVPTSEEIILRIGERQFHTTRQTLVEESGFFASIFSGRWNSIVSDGSYFINADGDVFVHILRCLRHGVFSVLYDSAKGHDYAGYFAIQAQAEFLLIPKLEQWVREKRYLRAFMLEHVITLLDVEEPYKTTRLESNVQIEYHPQRKITKVYIYPRRISMHRGDPSRCGRQ